MSSTSRTLKTVVFMGSSRNTKMPFGHGRERLGTGVLNWVIKSLQSRTSTIGEETVQHDITIYDPVEVFGENGAIQNDGHLSVPHFFMKKGENPTKMDIMAQTIKSADCFVIVTPEYNHSIPPALSSLMGHFGGSNYAFKPSAIVTYSVGPWGGTRAAIALRPFLSELGCLPVSKLTCLSSAQDLFEDDGTVKDLNSRLLSQFPSMMDQLEWFALACSNQRQLSGIPN